MNDWLTPYEQQLQSPNTHSQLKPCETSHYFPSNHSHRQLSRWVSLAGKKVRCDLFTSTITSIDHNFVSPSVITNTIAHHQIYRAVQRNSEKCDPMVCPNSLSPS